MARSSRKAWASDTGAGSAIGRARAIERGTTASIKARREAAPMTDSICCSSSAPGPMWRARNSAGFSSASRDGVADINMARFPGRWARDQSDFKRAS